MYTEQEISEMTGFDHGIEFGSKEMVIGYFKLQNMREMFYGYGDDEQTDVELQAELDEMAQEVIENKYHCTF